MEIEDMPSGAVSGGLQGAELYLHTMEELSRQLEQAMDAIVARSLPALQDSICRQRFSCSHLLALPRYLHTSGELEPTGMEVGEDAELAARISAAGDALQTLNRRYSALLGHTGDTMKLMARFLGGYGVSVPAGLAASRASLSTWSCEV